MRSLPLLLTVLTLAAVLGTPLSVCAPVHFDLGAQPTHEYAVTFARGDAVNASINVTIYLSSGQSVLAVDHFWLCAFCDRAVGLVNGSYIWFANFGPSSSTSGSGPFVVAGTNETIVIVIPGSYPPGILATPIGPDYGVIVVLFVCIAVLVGLCCVIVFTFYYVADRVSRPKTIPNHPREP